ncbi:MAG: phage tail protein [Staphylococcus equorum]|uniref:prophage endopeptidase tail family protein n=1 Tax=Staphylococcus TaxID=1279 RepID=UPI0025530FA4|nr:prophage endopeptidase tail family protein [Staphylococcus equorum]MDK9870680.1 prophage endopeptidase tail family protein [Staphylococcus equorum]MDK9876078.1 prophage endopeptidase tail family protein [Staphylococcus equorum]MDN6570296.1 phage tail protein [Staphylococcus equorum]MDN6611513.1 phage tail protein [Staphylococcus equorum]MDN6742120.1 phage tail protein [Staphylococcus equorum]
MAYSLILKNKSGTLKEHITDYGSFVYEWEKNNERSISFTAYKTSNNADIFDAIVNESLVEWEDESYVIKSTSLKADGTTITNDVIAKHIFMELQNHFVEDESKNKIESDSSSEDKQIKVSYRKFMGTIFKDNPMGFYYVTHGNFDDVYVDSLGDKNALEMLVEGAELFNYIYFAYNKAVHIYTEDEFYKMSGEPLIYKYNTDNVQATTTTTELKTYIVGYGKKFETKEFKDYQPLKPSDLTYTGKFERSGTWSTEQVGAYYDGEIDCKFGNETIYWNLKKMSKGGIVSVYYDTKLIGNYSCYSKNAKTDKIILDKKASKGKHKIRVIFKGEDSKVDYKKSKACMYVGTSSAKVFNVTTTLNGDGIYKAKTEYKSPNYEQFGKLQANTFYSDSITSETELKKELKSQLNDVPTVKLSTNYISYEDIKEYNKMRLIHRPLGFNTDLKVVKITKHHPLVNEPVEVEFSNAAEDIISIQRRISNQIKRVNNYVKGGKLNVIGGYKMNLTGESVGSVLIDD